MAKTSKVVITAKAGQAAGKTVLAEETLAAIEAAMTEAPAVEVGQMVRYVLDNGSIRPAIVTCVADGVNLQVFVDGGNDGYSADQVAVWRAGVAYSAGREPGTWH